MRLDPSGRAVVATGACCQGQGHETSFAQIAADALGIPLDWVTVVGGDTAAIPFGVGHLRQPRSAVNAGSSIHVASGRVRDKLVARGGRAARGGADGRRGRATARSSVRGAPGSVIAARPPCIRAAMPDLRPPGVAALDFEATVYHHQPTVTYTSAVHVAVREVDAGTGAVALRRYLVAHDCGTVINPVIVEGQIHGGVAQGVGGALLEEMVYDEQGQLLTGTFMDYLVPDRDGAAADRDGPSRVPVAAQPARRQGRRRGRRHLAARGHRQRGGGRARPVRRARDADAARPVASCWAAGDGVKPAPFDYAAPADLDEAVAPSPSTGGDAKVLAGGQSLIPMLAFRLARPPLLVDINRLPGARRHPRGLDGASWIGALVRQRALERWAVYALPLFAEALRHCRPSPIRNRGTVGGQRGPRRPGLRAAPRAARPGGRWWRAARGASA